MAVASVVLRRWWLFALLALAGVAVALALTSRTPARYQSTVSLQLNPAARSGFLRYDNAAGTSDLGPVAALAASYVEVLKSRSFGEVVVQKLQLAVPPEVIAGAIEARLVPNTNILRLTITWDQPQDAQQLAQSVAEIFISENLQRQASLGPRPEDLEQSARELQTRLTALRQQRDRLDQTVARGDLSRLTELNDMDTRLSALETSYANLLVEANQVRSSLDTAAILDSASAPQIVGVPALWQAGLFGLAGGLAVAGGLALLLDYLADAVRTPEDVMALAGSAPLVTIGRAPSGRGAAEPGPNLLVTSASRSPVTEAFRTLRMNLRLAALERPLRSLVITSAGPRDGKTFVSANLAAALAQAGQRVLLVDADLRRPAAHLVFGLANEGGLMAALATEFEQVRRDRSSAAVGGAVPPVGVVPTEVDDLWLMPAGGTPPNPSELLGSAAIPRLLACWTAHFDVVVVDTAPIGPVADALPLAAAVDGVLVVARSGHTRRAALRRALEVLNGAGRTVLGLVLNELQPGPLARYSPYGYYYAHYYGQPETATTPAVALSATSVHTNGATRAASTAQELKRGGGGTD